MKEPLICNRCCHELKCEYSEPIGDDESVNSHYKCLYCGAEFDIYEPSDEQQSEFDFYKDGEPIDSRIDEPDIMNGHCLNCGHKIYVENNFMLSDYDDTISDENNDKMSFVMSECPYCGISEERWDTAENDKEKYPYWNEDDVDDK